jgi:hypothetical protein
MDRRQHNNQLNKRFSTRGGAGRQEDIQKPVKLNGVTRGRCTTIGSGTRRGGCLTQGIGCCATGGGCVMWALADGGNGINNQT